MTLFAKIDTMNTCPKRRSSAIAIGVVLALIEPICGTPLPTIAQTSRDRPGDRLLEQGIQQYRIGQPQAAVQTLQQALQQFQAIGDSKQVVKTLRSLGNAYYVMTNYTQAIAYYQQSLDLARQTFDREGEGSALGNLGVVDADQGNYARATDRYQQALTLYRQTHDRLGEGQTLGNLGNLALQQIQYDRAIDFFQQAIAIAQEVRDPLLEMNTVGSLGSVYYGQSNYARAIALHEQQLSLARQLNSRLVEGAALNNLANTYLALGDYGKALERYQQRLAIAQAIRDRLGETQAYGNLSNVYYDLGDPAKAIAAALRSLQLAQEIQNRPAQAAALSTLGNLYGLIQDYPQALEFLQKRLALAKQLNDREGMGIAYGNLGNLSRQMGNSQQAIDFHQQALALARAINSRLGESAALSQLGTDYDDRREFDPAIAFYKQALNLAQAIGDRPTEALVQNNLGNTLFKLGKLAEAEKVLVSGLRSWETLRAGLGSDDLNKVSIFDQQARTYRLLQRVLVAQNKFDRALEIAERGRARAFVELLLRRRGDRLRGNESSGLTIAQMQQVAKTQNSTLVQYSLTYEDISSNGKILAQESALFIWVIAPTGHITFRRVDLKPLAKQGTSIQDLVVANRASFGVRGRGVAVVANSDRGQEAARSQQYQLLIAPIADLLPKNAHDRVTFIPQGSLFLVPFAALRAPSGRYLIEDHTILTAPSIQVLDLTHRQRHSRSPSPPLVVGNPVMPRVSLKPGDPPEPLAALPGAEQEARTIAALLQTQAITGDRATKAAIVPQMMQASIIHLATHGLLDDFTGRGLPGAIALAPMENDTGLLTADEILDLQLKADLVVLSACDTGRGRITGDGVVGLSRAFLSAGVPSLVVSLWSVPDAPTANLMATFYQALQHQPDKAQALRQAMLTTMQQYPNPRDWAAFTLIGEAD